MDNSVFVFATKAPSELFQKRSFESDLSFVCVYPKTPTASEKTLEGGFDYIISLPASIV